MPKTPTDIASLARRHTELALNTLKSIAAQKKAPESARVAAATALLNRGWGMPKQTLDHNVNPLEALYGRVVDETSQKPKPNGKANGVANGAHE